MQDELTIGDEATLRVVADPLRRRIMLHLGSGRSIGEVAQLLEETPQRLYYHFRVLERHGLIRCCDHRQQGNHIERLYEVVARSVRIEPELARAVGYGVNLGVQTILEESAIRFSQARRDLERAGDLDGHPSMQMFMVGRLPRRRAEELKRRLGQLAREFFDDEKPGDGVRYGLCLVVHPAGPEPAAVGRSGRSSARERRRKR